MKESENAREGTGNGGVTDVVTIARHLSESVTLVATQLLSLTHWHYLGPSQYESTEDKEDLKWYSVEWLKQAALDFGLAWVRLGSRCNEKFLNQLLALAIYEYE